MMHLAARDRMAIGREQQNLRSIHSHWQKLFENSIRTVSDPKQNAGQG